MTSPPPSRRTVLRGLLGGAAVSVALPALESLAPRRAYAAGDVFPVRYVQFFWGNGILPERWIPATTGADYALSDQLQPLAEVQADVTVISGFEVKVANRIAHLSGPSGLLSGVGGVGEGDDHTFGAPSLDQRIAAELGGLTAYRSLELGVQPGAKGLSYTGPSTRNPPISEPIAAFERLFGPSFRAPGESGVIDPRLALRRSVLDAVTADAADLARRVGAADRARLDQHLSGVRDLEQRIARLSDDPPDFAACVRPEPPPGVPDVDGRPQMAERARIMADLLALSLACDLTRVASIWYSDPLSDVLYPGATAGHHQLTHDEPGDQPQVHQIVLAAMTAFADLVRALKAVPEGEGTLLDHLALLGTTDVSYGRTHQIDEFPILLAGGADGRLVHGQHVRSATADNASRVPLTLLRAVGIPAASFGVDAANTDVGVSEVEA